MTYLIHRRMAAAEDAEYVLPQREILGIQAADNAQQRIAGGAVYRVKDTDLRNGKELYQGMICVHTGWSAYYENNEEIYEMDFGVGWLLPDEHSSAMGHGLWYTGAEINTFEKLTNEEVQQIKAFFELIATAQIKAFQNKKQ